MSYLTRPPPRLAGQFPRQRPDAEAKISLSATCRQQVNAAYRLVFPMALGCFRLKNNAPLFNVRLQIVARSEIGRFLRA